MEDEYVEELDAEQEEAETPEQEQPETEAEEAEVDAEQEEAETTSKNPVIPRKAYQAEKEKRQGLEKRLQEMEQQLAATKNAPISQKQPETIEELFDVNPDAALSHIDQQIRAAKDAYDVDAEQRYKDLKVDLVARGLRSQHQRQSQETLTSKINSEIYKSIPDFDTKKTALVALAVEYGLTEQEAAQVMDPTVVGDTAARMAKMLNKVHAVVNAGKTAKTKEVKQPNRTEPAGAGGFSNNNQPTKLLNRAKESGNLDDWASLLG